MPLLAGSIRASCSLAFVPYLTLCARCLRTTPRLPPLPAFLPQPRPRPRGAKTHLDPGREQAHLILRLIPRLILLPPLLPLLPFPQPRQRRGAVVMVMVMVVVAVILIRASINAERITCRNKEEQGNMEVAMRPMQLLTTMLKAIMAQPIMLEGPPQLNPISNPIIISNINNNNNNSKDVHNRQKFLRHDLGNTVAKFAWRMKIAPQKAKNPS
mmetsp:Transcript_17076/g.31099  ORF Transcript_17076/g.31099 Transcript_17076/m.31099 type:complete len:213 (-) Transcript_17076:235-873(-)